MNKLGDHCPTCEQSVDASFKQGLIDAEARKLLKHGKNKMKLMEEYNKLNETMQSFKMREKLKTTGKICSEVLTTACQSQPLDPVELKGRANRIQERISDAKDRMVRLTRENEAITKRNTRIQVILEQTEEFQQELFELNEVLDLETATASNLEVLKKAFSTNGLLAYKIENLVKELEELTNNYLGRIVRWSFYFGVRSIK